MVVRACESCLLSKRQVNVTHLIKGKIGKVIIQVIYLLNVFYKILKSWDLMLFFLCKLQINQIHLPHIANILVKIIAEGE